MLKKKILKILPLLPRRPMEIIVQSSYEFGRKFIDFSARLHRNTIAAHTKEWLKIKGDQTLRLNYDLNENSIVFDIGGFIGDWAAEIFTRYNCYIYVFEPVPDAYQQIKSRFIKNPRVFSFPFGLSSRTKKVKMFLCSHGSSAYRVTDNDIIEVDMKSAAEFINEKLISQIDLLKINIEGGEYDLLEHLITTEYIKIIKNIQVQFHDFVPDAGQHMKKIQNQLTKTHHLTYQYPFVWENWKLNM